MRDGSGAERLGAMKVECDCEQVTLENERGNEVKGVRVKCSRCDHVVESFGTGDASKRRCLALMREQCPMGEENFYFIEEPPEQPDWWSEKPPRGKEVPTPDVLKNLPKRPPRRA
jgi:hypothetical protein